MGLSITICTIPYISLIKLPSKLPDYDSDSNANHASDGGVPHIRDRVNWDVVELLAILLGLSRVDCIDPLLRAPIDRGKLGSCLCGGAAEIRGHSGSEADPHG